MSSPSSWPPPGSATPPPPEGPPAEGPAGSYSPLQYAQGYAQPHPSTRRYAEPVLYGSTDHPSPYAVPVPVPRPERALMPAVWWSLVINLVVTVLVGLAALLVGWAFVELIASSLGENVSWSDAAGDDGVGAVVLVVAAIMVGSVLVSWLITVAALVLWRLIRGFRSIPVFAQALIAFVTMWVVTTVLSFVAQIVFGVFGAATGVGDGTY